MKFNLKDLNEEDLSRVRRLLLDVARSYEPWADGMNLSGAGDPDADGFPLDVDQIESIEIHMVGAEGSQESTESSQEVK